MAWYPELWRDRPAAQQPDWPPEGIDAVRDALANRVPLTTPRDVRAVRAALGDVQAHRAVLLQAGDCAEPIGVEAVSSASGKHGLLGALALTISAESGVPVVTVGRLAGQFGKPRSQLVEVVDGVPMPAFQGQIVNDVVPDRRARVPDPTRLLWAYDTARAVIGELAVLADMPRGAEAPPLLSAVDGYGRTRLGHDGSWTHTGLWTSHEALLLNYEEPLVRRDQETGEWYLLSTHLPWIGYRTNQVDGAHVAFLAGVANPVACKLGPDTTESEVARLCARLDPDRRPGRLTLMARMGRDRVRDRLPKLVRAVRRGGHPVVWVCDPMHANTVKTPTGTKTRHCADIAHELREFFAVLRELGEWPGGMHLEVAADHVTECVDDDGVTVDQLHRAYRSLCDPRLNDVQATRMAAEFSALLGAAVGRSARAPAPAAGS